MPGLSLGLNMGAAVPSPALPPSYAGTAAGGTISSRAYGITSGTGATVPGTRAAYGSMAVSLGAVAFLTWLWWTLPR